MAKTARYRKKPADRSGRGKKKGKKGAFFDRRLRELGGLAMAAAGCFLALVLYLGWSGGLAGIFLEDLLRYLVGVIAFLSPLAFIGGGLLMIFPDAPLGSRGVRAGAAMFLAGLFLAAGANVFSILGSSPAHHGFFDSAYVPAHGGVAGDALYWVTSSLAGDVGSTIAAVLLLLSAAFLITGTSVRTVLLASGRRARTVAGGACRTTVHMGHNLAQRRSRAGEAAAAAGAGGAFEDAASAGAPALPFGVEPA